MLLLLLLHELLLLLLHELLCVLQRLPTRHKVGVVGADGCCCLCCYC
jgi:hypothetical protein